jgi:tRNA modification GTPase
MDDCNEFLMISFRLAMVELGRVTGYVDVEELLDVIFRDFCIGK